MKQILALLLILFIFSLEQTNAQSINTEHYKLKIQKGSNYKKNGKTFFVIPVTITNLSKDTLKYFSLACSPEYTYLVDNEKLYKMSNICQKDFPIIIILAQNKSKTVQLTLTKDETLNNSEISFKIGLNFKPANKPRQEFNIKEFINKNEVIWSNTITI